MQLLNVSVVDHGTMDIYAPNYTCCGLVNRIMNALNAEIKIISANL